MYLPIVDTFIFIYICFIFPSEYVLKVRLSSEGNGGTDKKGCSRCGKSRCLVCHIMSNSEHFSIENR